jgi:cytochrome c oxidase subunit 3
MRTVTQDEIAHEEELHHDAPFLAHHFDTPAQQFDAAKLGMWVFIATEILMFGGLFVAYGIYRGHGDLDKLVFDVASHQLAWKLGALNTCVLLFSSLTAALAVRSAQLGNRNHVTILLVITILCACAFLVVKYFEYSHKYEEGFLPGRCFGHPAFSGDCLSEGKLPAPIAEMDKELIEQAKVKGLPAPPLGASTRANMFFGLYFMMTGLHGLHVLVGMSLLTWVLVKNIRGRFSPRFFTPVDLGALYWHLVDLVWIYLFPLLYLIDLKNL